MATPASTLSVDRGPGRSAPTPFALRSVRASGPKTVRARLVLPTSSPDVRVRVKVGDREWLLDEGRVLTLGRAPENDVVLEGEEVSRLHAEVRRRGGLVHLSDRSSNGTYVTSPGLDLVRVQRESILIVGGETTLHLGTQDRAAVQVCIEERSGDGTWRPIGATADESDPLVASLQREGEYWTIAHAGRTVRLKDTKGLRFLRELVSAPGRELSALDLVRLVERTPVGTPSTAKTSGGLPLLDDRARAQYRRRLSELREDLDEAESRADLGRSEHIRDEIETLTQELSRAFGLGGRERPQGEDGERARVLVTVRMREALRKIAELAPELGTHLASSVRTGRSCSYAPTEGNAIDWRC